MSEFNPSAVVDASRLLPGIRSSLVGLVPRVVERWRRHRTAATLRRLDDRQLEDIGMSRNDILYVAAALATAKSESAR